MTIGANGIADVPVAREISQREAAGDQRWLVSRNFDALAVLCGSIVVSVLLYASASSGAALAIGGALFAMLTDMPHVIQTSLRVGLDPRERALHGRRYLASFVVIAAGTLLLFATDHRPEVAMIWIVWQFLHVVKQHYGIVRIYGAKNGYRGPSRLMAAVLVLGCGSPVLYRIDKGMRFGEYYVLGDRMPFSGLGLPELPIPLPLIVAAYLAFGCVALLYAREQLSLRAQGQRPLPWIAQATIVLALISYNLSYLFISDLYALIMIAAAVHSLQYHAISWRRNHGRFARAQDAGESATFLGSLSRRESVLGYAALSVLVGALIASTETLWLGFIPFVVVLHHFYMDGYVWRSALNPTLASDLGIPRRTVLSSRTAPCASTPEAR